ncbi:hypothetical protein [Alteraurantiacibacter buctensis]|uniref:Uncharacterized protein n=1 Tax=Alteraurantiacibacter buctensis TaxID=1503981 RepID=A0A844Z081_9SPHN|nr:hypothetical protein [Alteraurantiacibacter buctensis]MXO72892.1 hypothetical protein [Alteraurantiacibacter buctensis]
MSATITLGLWIIPTIVSAFAMIWCSSQDYRGDYNFNALFFVPVTALIICAAWMIYFGIGWALS